MHEIITLIAQGYHHVLNFLNAVPNGAWAALLASPFLSGGIQWIKHWLSIQNEKIMITVVTIVCFIGSAVYYLIQTNPNNPLILGAQTAILGFTTQPFYYAFIKPLYKRLNTDLELQSLGKSELQTASIPAEGLPVSGQVVSTTVSPRQQFENSISMENFDL